MPYENHRGLKRHGQARSLHLRILQYGMQRKISRRAGSFRNTLAEPFIRKYLSPLICTSMHLAFSSAYYVILAAGLQIFFISLYAVPAA